MRKHYNFSKSEKNPYAAKLKVQITIRLDEETVKYFKKIAKTTGIPYQNLINLYLRDCMVTKKKPQVKWDKAG